MKVVIAGSRSIINYNAVVKAVKESGFEVTEVVCGGAIGVDSLGERYARENNLKLSFFKPDYKQHKHNAPNLRNSKMAVYGDALIAVWNGHSSGTKHMIEMMERNKKPVFVKIIP